MKYLAFLLKASRPGLWFVTLWLYMLAMTKGVHDFDFNFWLGFFFCTFPLNLMIYGWNDAVDQETDAENPRKDSFLFGAKGSPKQLANIWKSIVLVQLPFVLYFSFIIGLPFLVLYGCILLINWLYNLKKRGLRGQPPLELLCQVGYLLLVPFSTLLNDQASLSFVTYGYLLLFAWQSHLIGEVMDIVPDKATGRKTTATVLGIYKTKVLIVGIVALEIFIIFYCFQDTLFAAMLGTAIIWLLLDLFVINKSKPYDLFQIKLFGIISNVLGIGSMLYVYIFDVFK